MYFFECNVMEFFRLLLGGGLTRVFSLFEKFFTLIAAIPHVWTPFGMHVCWETYVGLSEIAVVKAMTYPVKALADLLAIV